MEIKNLMFIISFILPIIFISFTKYNNYFVKERENECLLRKNKLYVLYFLFGIISSIFSIYLYQKDFNNYGFIFMIISIIFYSLYACFSMWYVRINHNGIFTRKYIGPIHFIPDNLIESFKCSDNKIEFYNKDNECLFVTKNYFVTNNKLKQILTKEVI